MKSFTKSLLIFIIFISFTKCIKAQEENTSTIFYEKDTIILKHLENFKDMHVGYYGTTQRCEPYNVYAFKYRYHWFLFIKKDNKLSFMQIKPPIKDKEIYYPSRHFVEGLSRCYSLGYTKFVKRKRNVLDMDVYGYYKFNRYGRRVMRGLLLLEYPFYTKGFFSRKLKAEEVKKEAKEAVKQKLPKKPEVKPNKLEILKKIF